MASKSPSSAVDTQSATSLTDRIIEYWYGSLDDAVVLDMKSEQCRRWHAKDPQTDAEIRRLFSVDYEAARASAECRMANTSRDHLAFVIMFDQFSRNMGRDTPVMYESD